MTTPFHFVEAREILHELLSLPSGGKDAADLLFQYTERRVTSEYVRLTQGTNH